MLHQTYHQRPIVGGYTSRHFPYSFADTAPGVAQLLHEDPDPLTTPDILMPSPLETALGSLDFYNIRFIVAHKADLATGREASLRKVINALFTDKDKAYEDADVIVYQVPTQINEGDTLPLVGLGKGWYKAEQNPLHRWTGSSGTDGNAAVWLSIPPGAEGHYTLKLNVYAYKSPRTLSVLINGNSLLTKQIGATFQDIEVDLSTLTPGNYDLLLQVKEPPENPPGDQRSLSIGVTRLSIERVERK